MTFTLYCFAKVFNLSYSGKTAKLLSLFDTYTSPDALTKVVIGHTDSSSYVERISIDSPEAKKVMKSLRADRVEFVYRLVTGTDPENQNKENLVRTLLEYALLLDKDKQKYIYDQKNTDEVRNYIDQIKNMTIPVEHTEKHTDTNSIQQPQHVMEQTESSLSEFETAKQNTNLFFDYLDRHANEIASLLIASHAGSDWLQPTGLRYRLIKKLSDLNVEVRVILNSSSATEVIRQHLRDTEADQMGMYRPIADILHAWNVLSSSKKQIHVKISDCPLFHNVVCCTFHGNGKGLMRIGMYTYGIPLEESHPRLFIDNEDAHFPVLQKEFEYLWNISHEVKIE